VPEQNGLSTVCMTKLVNTEEFGWLMLETKLSSG
jgi:hypothetical protein